MTFDEKLADAKALIADVLAQAKRPAVMCSFGKDSMVVLHMITRAMGRKLPVIFHREPFMPAKYLFANTVIRAWDLTVYDFPPTNTAVAVNGDAMEVVNYYPAGAQTCALPTGLCKPARGEKPLCALEDFYMKPTAAGFAYPWDVVFHGHKSSDVDPIYGAVPLASDFARNIGTASVAFPLRHFTDADVWEYHKRMKIPVHSQRYEETPEGWREKADKTANPDYFPACWACMVQGGKAVPCPKLNGRMVSNISAQLRWAPREKLSYLETPAK